jgi:hypothetical protein
LVKGKDDEKENKVNVFLEDTIQKFIQENQYKKLVFNGGSINQN